MESNDANRSDVQLAMQLRDAMVTLFSGFHNDRIGLANQFLLEASENPLAFKSLLLLLSKENDFRIAHFSVNLLYNKVVNFVTL
jgi:hypothetical protein